MLITSQTPVFFFFRKLLENILYQHKAINQEKRKELYSKSTQSEQETQRIKGLVRTDVLRGKLVQARTRQGKATTTV